MNRRLRVLQIKEPQTLTVADSSRDGTSLYCDTSFVCAAERGCNSFSGEIFGSTCEPLCYQIVVCVWRSLQQRFFHSAPELSHNNSSLPKVCWFNIGRAIGSLEPFNKIILWFTDAFSFANLFWFLFCEMSNAANADITEARARYNDYALTQVNLGNG